MKQMPDFNRIHLNGAELYWRDGALCTAIHTAGMKITYELPEVSLPASVDTVLMDMDGTSVMSEDFWVYIIGKTVGELLCDPTFSLKEEDIPFVSGYSVVQHLQYCIDKYVPTASLSEADALYHGIALRELDEIMQGRGNIGAFRPRPGLKRFLLSLKAAGVRIGLVTSGLEYKVRPEITAVFRRLGMGDPRAFYDAVICGGKRKQRGEYGTVGELAVKPHPWLYAEIGMTLCGDDRSRAVAIEDTASGVLSARIAGYPVLGMADGNLQPSGTDQLCAALCETLDDVLLRLGIPAVPDEYESEEE